MLNFCAASIVVFSCDILLHFFLHVCHFISLVGGVLCIHTSPMQGPPACPWHASITGRRRVCSSIQWHAFIFSGSQVWSTPSSWRRSSLKWFRTSSSCVREINVSWHSSFWSFLEERLKLEMDNSTIISGFAFSVTIGSGTYNVRFHLSATTYSFRSLCGSSRWYIKCPMDISSSYVKLVSKFPLLHVTCLGITRHYYAVRVKFVNLFSISSVS